MRKMPARRTVLSVVLLLALSYGAFLVGNTLNRPNLSGGETIENHAFWDKTVYGTQGDAVTAVASMAATDAAVAAEAARSASSPLSTLFGVVSVTGEGFSPNDVVEDLGGRMVVYTAQIGLKVEEVDITLDEIKLISIIHGGYISGVNTRDERGSVTLRIPQSRFHDAITDLEELGEVTTRDLMGEDVTEEYVDLEAQLVSLEHQEARLFEIMEMGTTVDSVLKVERELERVRSRIESIKGRIKFLDNRVELSTITISLREEVPEVEVIQAWFPAVNWGVPVRTGLSVLFTITQGMVTMVIILGPFIALGYGGVRVLRWYRAKPVTPEEPLS